MKFEITFLNAATKGDDIIKEVKRFVKNEKQYKVSFFINNPDFEDSENIVIVEGDYNIIRGIAKVIVEKHENIVYSSLHKLTDNLGERFMIIYPAVEGQDEENNLRK